MKLLSSFGRGKTKAYLFWLGHVQAWRYANSKREPRQLLGELSMDYYTKKDKDRPNQNLYQLPTHESLIVAR
jgi:hypothetical protein